MAWPEVSAEALADPEFFTPFSHSGGPYISWSTGESWASVARHYSNIVEERLRGAKVEKLVKETLEGNETALEKSAVAILERASSAGSVSAIKAAKAEFGRARFQPVARSLKSKCETLAEQLFASIGSQTSVKKYKAIAWERGAFLDGIDVPLNNSVWMCAELDRIGKLSDEADRLSALGEIVNRNNAHVVRTVDDFPGFAHRDAGLN